MFERFWNRYLSYYGRADQTAGDGTSQTGSIHDGVTTSETPPAPVSSAASSFMIVDHDGRNASASAQQQQQQGAEQSKESNSSVTTNAQQQFAADDDHHVAWRRWLIDKAGNRNLFRREIFPFVSSSISFLCIFLPLHSFHFLSSFPASKWPLRNFGERCYSSRSGGERYLQPLDTLLGL